MIGASPIRLRRGFTLLEMVSVVVILVSLLSLLQPTISRAVHSAQTWGSNARMRQAFVALSLYAADADGAEVGTASEMGLPTLAHLWAMPSLPGTDVVWRSVCPQLPDGPSGRVNFAYFPDDEPMWAELVSRHEGATVVMADFNCLWPRNSLDALFLSKTVYSIRLDGSLRRTVATGDPKDWSWWYR